MGRRKKMLAVMLMSLLFLRGNSPEPGPYFHSSDDFEVSADGSELILWEGGHVTPLETPFTAVNGGTIYWSDLSPAGNGDRAYIFQ